MLNVSKKQMLYLAAAVVVGLILAWLLLSEESTSVEVATSRRGPMTVAVEAEGKTRARVKITVSAPVSGRMSRIKLTEGDFIPHDYPITEIDPNPPVQRTPDKRDELPNIYAARVFAPIAGKVLRIAQKSEGFVTAGTPLIEIGDPDNIEIVVDVLSTDAVKIPPGAPIMVINESSTEPLKARVHLIEPQATTKVSALGVEEQRVNVIGEFFVQSAKVRRQLPRRREHHRMGIR
ncbi:MAG: HlyD family efflux transporter periplasmic adaptor subunit [Acidobacteria bacterium]|nr:HlyD family efflux transporter periplasmic adaptor subunit [Acidobacteriota bacterium]